MAKDTPFRSSGPSVPAKTANYSAPRGITAAASIIDINDKVSQKRIAERTGKRLAVLQSAAWEYFDAINEIKYAFNMVASIVSRIRLYVAIIEDPAEPPVPMRISDRVEDDLRDQSIRTLDRLSSAYGGQAGLLKDAALNLLVAGECYLVQIPERPASNIKESWDIRSVDELRVTRDGQYYLVSRADQSFGSAGQAPADAIMLPPDAFKGRIWRAHPRFSEDPDSSLLGMTDLCEELLLLDKVFRATHRSRLNAGLLYVPDALSTSAAPDPALFEDTGDGTLDPYTSEDAADEFEEQLILGMSTPIVDEDSASAIVPIIIRGPADLAEKVKHIKMERAFDENMVHRADRVLERIMQGLDVPKDVVTGLANVKYSNAIQIDEALYKAHIEPMLLLLADSLTQVFLRPALIKAGYPDSEVNKIVVWYDPSAVATRNDRAADADAGFEKGAISYEAWRDAHGFSEKDAPTQTEALTRMVLNMGVLSPELTASLLGVIAPDLMQAARGINQADSVAPIPDAANQILNGGTPPATPGASPDATAPSDGTTPPADGTAAPGALPTDQGATVAPGEDAPPFPLAEPSPGGDNSGSSA